MTDDRSPSEHVLERPEPVETWQASWSFFCRRCARSWTRRYEVRRYRRNDGEWVVHLRGGHLAQPPRLESRCPHCGGLRVRLLPTGGTP